MPIIPPDDPGDHGKFVAPIDVNIVGGGSVGDATAANQVTGNNSLASIDSKLVANPLTDAELRATAVPVDGSAVTQPVSATSLPLPAGASTSALQSTGNASLSSVDGKLGTLGQKLMVGSAPVVIASDQSSIPVTTASLPLPTGAATSALQTTGNTSLSAIAASVAGVLAISATALPLPTGAATSALQTTGNSSLSSIDGKTPALGQALAGASVPVVLTAAQLITLTPPAAITGFATSALQTSGNASLTSIDSKLTSPLTVTGPLTDAELRATAVPVSGTVTANAGTGTFAVSAAILPLPTGAATSANQTTANTSLSSIDGKLGTLGQKTMAGSAPVVIASDQSNLPSNLKQINGTTVDSNAGNASAGTQRVVLATDQPTVPVSTAPATSGGNSIYRNLDVNATGQLIKASAGQIYAINVSNVVAQDRFLKFYNKASAPTVGTDTPVMTVVVPKSASGGSVNISVPSGIAFGTGIGVGCTTAVADASVANPGVNDIVLNVLYK